MPVLLKIPVSDSGDLLRSDTYAAGALIRVESSTDGSAYTEQGTVAIVDLTTEYEFGHPAGTADTYYRWRFSNAAATRLSDYSDVIRGTELAGSTAPGPVGHCYANLDQFKRYLVDVPGDYGNLNDDRLLRALLAASRKIDNHCSRTGYGYVVSGFGPRLGTNRYNGPGGRSLDLQDDLLTLTSVAVLDSVGSTPQTYTDETDFYKGPFDVAPYRSLDLHGNGQTTWYSARRGVSVVGKWGKLDQHEQLGILSTAVTSTTATTIHVSVEPSPGHTFLVGSEQQFVRAVDTHSGGGWDATVVRSANGTTATTHLVSAQVDVYTYPPEVTECCLVIGQRALKSRDAGLTGDFGGLGGVPTQTHRDTERSVLREYLWPYAMVRI